MSPAERLVARRVRFDWARTPVHWVPGDPRSTHTMNVLHLLLPAGERWFVDVFRQALPLVTDDALRREVRGFMGQEATHSRAHAAVLDHLDAQGVDTGPAVRRIELMFGRLLGDEPLGRPFGPRVARLWLKERLAIIAAIEHMTAVLGDWVLRADALDRVGADPVMVDLLRWHGAEEVEHRSVAFDLFVHLDGSPVRRVRAMLIVAPVLLGLWRAGTGALLRADPTTTLRPSLRHYGRTARRGVLPGPWALGGAVPHYLRKGFHPSQEGDTDRALAYLAGSPAVASAGDRPPNPHAP